MLATAHPLMARRRAKTGHLVAARTPSKWRNWSRINPECTMCECGVTDVGPFHYGHYLQDLSAPVSRAPPGQTAPLARVSILRAPHVEQANGGNRRLPFAASICPIFYHHFPFQGRDDHEEEYKQFRLYPMATGIRKGAQVPSLSSAARALTASTSNVPLSSRCRGCPSTHTV